MDRKSFKIGDKVKVCDSLLYQYDIDEHLYREGITGKVIGVSRSIHVKWDTDRCVICGSDNCGLKVTTWYHKPYKIKRIKRVGEQLLFSFMKGS